MLQVCYRITIVVIAELIMDVKQRLIEVAEDGNVEILYMLLSHDPYILERFDRLPFCDTPLHVAARTGKTHFAMEIATLKPSLFWKLNESGLTPMHLALQNDCFQMVRGFMAIDNSLIRIKGRGGITPLHYVAQTSNIELLSEFLNVFPSSIDELTIKCETAMHIAVKNHNFKAFKVMLRWLQRVNREDILNWKDEDDNTIFHIATSTNQTEVMKLLHRIVNVNAKNFKGETAMDIFQSHQSSLSTDMSKILCSAKAKAAEELVDSTTTLGGYFSKRQSLFEKQNRVLGHRVRKHGSCSTNDFNSALVVAILIVTATYQASLSPPGGYWQDTLQASGGSHGSEKLHSAGQMTMPLVHSVFFFSLNGLAFFLSLWVILTLIIGLPKWRILYVSICLLMYATHGSFQVTLPPFDSSSGEIARKIFSTAYFVLSLFVMFVPWITFYRHESLRQRVDSFSGSFKKLP